MFEIKKVEFVNKTFRLEKKLAERLSECSAEHNISVNALVAQCCEYALDHMHSPYKDIQKWQDDTLDKPTHDK